MELWIGCHQSGYPSIPGHTTSHMGICFFCSLTTLLVILKVGNTILSTNIHDDVLTTTKFEQVHTLYKVNKGILAFFF